MSALELERSCVLKGDASPGDHAWIGQPMALGLFQRFGWAEGCGISRKIGTDVRLSGLSDVWETALSCETALACGAD
jgi:hypothetical protein